MAEFGTQRLRIFLDLVKTGSFTLSARNFGISQPAVSQNISALEEQLGVRLIDRKKGAVAPTDRGRAFVKYAEKILYWHDAADRLFGEEARRNSDVTVRIAADGFCAGCLLPQALATLHASHPATSFNVVPQDADGVDAAISIRPVAESEDAIGTTDSVIFCRQDDELAWVSSLEWLPPQERFAVWKGCENALPADILSRVTLVSDSVELIRDMVATTSDVMGIAPRPAATGFQPLPIMLPGLAFAVRYTASPLFAARELSRLLSGVIGEALAR